MSTLRDLVQPALAIALLGSIESLLSATVADSMIGGQHRSNMELVAQGGANVLSALFGGIPATGAIARTATNVKNGGRTPVAGIVHAITLLAIMLLVAPLAGKIPLACLAGILVVVAYNMSEWRGFVSALKGNRYDVVVLLATFFITVIFDLVLAIEVGMVLAAFLFMKRMSDTVQLAEMTPEQPGEDMGMAARQGIPKGVLVYEINGPLFFGAAQMFASTLRQIGDKHKVLILQMRNVPLIDATGLHRIRDIVDTMERRNVQVLIAGANEQVGQEMAEAGILDPRSMYASLEDAVLALKALAGKA
jgi:SulP family sulfate permease